MIDHQVQYNSTDRKLFYKHFEIVNCFQIFPICRLVFYTATHESLKLCRQHFYRTVSCTLHRYPPLLLLFTCDRQRRCCTASFLWSRCQLRVSKWLGRCFSSCTISYVDVLSYQGTKYLKLSPLPFRHTVRSKAYFWGVSASWYPVSCLSSAVTLSLFPSSSLRALSSVTLCDFAKATRIS